MFDSPVFFLLSLLSFGRREAIFGFKNWFSMARLARCVSEISVVLWKVQ